MNGSGRLLALVALIGLLLLLGACGGAVDGTASCSCASGTTYGGTFYQEYANTSVRADAPIGKSDRAGGCCGENVPQVTVYSIGGIDSQIAIATRSSDGVTHFNVASDLSKREQQVADRFAKRHRDKTSS
jgi:hypothetical protein